MKAVANNTIDVIDRTGRSVGSEIEKAVPILAGSTLVLLLVVLKVFVRRFWQPSAKARLMGTGQNPEANLAAALEDVRKASYPEWPLLTNEFIANRVANFPDAVIIAKEPGLIFDDKEIRDAGSTWKVGGAGRFYSVRLNNKALNADPLDKNFRLRHVLTCTCSGYQVALGTKAVMKKESMYMDRVYDRGHVELDRVCKHAGAVLLMVEGCEA
jgi:hypothetical protein